MQSLLISFTNTLAKSFFTKLDIRTQYYVFENDEENQNLCTVIIPFRKYKHTCMLISLKSSPDIAQADMENILSSINAADMYIDDVKALSSSFMGASHSSY